MSPYDVFPPSQERFRRDTKGSQESYNSVGVMEEKSERAAHAKRKGKRGGDRR